MTSMEAAEYLLENAKVALVPGSAFGSEGEGTFVFLMHAAMKSWQRHVTASGRQWKH